MPIEDARVAGNRHLWTLVNAQHADAGARDKWQQTEISWGLFDLPEHTLQALGDVQGLDVLDLACGTGYFSAWLARAGARPVAVDLTPAQLDTARRCQRAFGIDFPLIEANAEAVPLPEASFDLIVSEHGAGVWCEPDAWVAEASRLLRPSGRLAFLVNSVLSAMCVPADGGVAGEQLLRGQRDIESITWPGGGSEYHLGHGQWIAVLRRHGFVVEALHELYPDADTASNARGQKRADRDYYEIVSPEWAHRWPAEELWVARLT